MASRKRKILASNKNTSKLNEVIQDAKLKKSINSVEAKNEKKLLDEQSSAANTNKQKNNYKRGVTDFEANKYTSSSTSSSSNKSSDKVKVLRKSLVVLSEPGTMLTKVSNNTGMKKLDSLSKRRYLNKKDEETMSDKAVKKKLRTRTVQTNQVLLKTAGNDNVGKNVNPKRSSRLKSRALKKSAEKVVAKKMAKTKSASSELQPIFAPGKAVLTSKNLKINKELSNSIKQETLTENEKGAMDSKLMRRKFPNNTYRPHVPLLRTVSPAKRKNFNQSLQKQNKNITNNQNIKKNLEEVKSGASKKIFLSHAWQPRVLLEQVALTDKDLKIKCSNKNDVSSKPLSSRNFQHRKKNKDIIKNEYNVANDTVKFTKTLHNLRRNKNVNYLENTLSTSSSPIQSTVNTQKLPIYKQQLENRIEEQGDLYEFDSDSETLAKNRKKQLDDPSFVLNIKSKRVRKKKNKVANLKSKKLFLKNNVFSEKSLAFVLPSKTNRELNKSIRDVKNKVNLQYTSVTLRPAVSSTPNNIHQNHVSSVASDKIFDHLSENFNESTNLSIIGRRPNANSTLIHCIPNKKRISTEHVIIEDDSDNWSDTAPSISPDRNILKPKLSFVENILNKTSITVATTPKLFSTSKRSKSVVTNKENMLPNRTSPLKTKKKKNIIEVSTPYKNNNTSHIDRDIEQIETITEKTPSIDNMENIQDNESSDDDDDDDWLKFDTEQKTYNNDKPTNDFRPWRFNQVNVNRNPLFITLKETALPSINQELVVDHKIANKILAKETDRSKNRNKNLVNDRAIQLFEDIPEPVSEEEVEELDDFDAKLEKKSRYKMKYFLKMDVQHKKPKDIRTKEEQKAADNWAKAFNSMCQEIEEFPLEIE